MARAVAALVVAGAPIAGIVVVSAVTVAPGAPEAAPHVSQRAIDRSTRHWSGTWRGDFAAAGRWSVGEGDHHAIGTAGCQSRPSTGTKSRVL